MGRIVMKESPESDFYVEWSSVVDAPVFAGTRADMLAHLQRDSDPWLREDAPHHPEQRLKRADETGTTSLWVTKANEESAEFAAHGYVEEGCWEDSSFIYHQQGTVTRANLFVLTRRIYADEHVGDLLEPFEDEETD